MRALMQSFLVMLATATDRQLAKQVQYLKKENGILRKRLERYQQVMALHHQGVSLRNISRQLGIHRATARSFLRAGSFPERAARTYPQKVNQYIPYLQRRWSEGCRNASQLQREVQAQGYRGSVHMVRRLVAPWCNHAVPESSRKSSVVRTPASKQIAAWILQRVIKRSTDEQAFLEHLMQTDTLRNAIRLAEQFAHLMRERQIAALPAWMTQVRNAANQPELQRFTKGLREDLAAVGAAIVLPWSNGPVEGQINRLKLIKRQMYGRGKFDLLRFRFLGAA